MIPIGAPVTVTWANEEKEPGIVSNHRGFYGWGVEIQPWIEVKVKISGTPTTFPAERVNIRYDNPTPFTLWQYYALSRITPSARGYAMNPPIFPLLAHHIASVFS